jgi:acetyl-CoA/propionyl-CoA carboxylase biotin carboxyl carrier protein
MFRAVLVANRGEIALRVIRTLREMGIRSVAVHSEVDADAAHVRAADEAVAIGPAPARESYLSAERILDAARRSGAEAIHPGYGFLSESAEFARRTAAAGLVFVGPSPAALEAAGDKVRARRTAEEVGVPIVPGTPPSDDLTTLARAARELPLPVLVKAAGGGGGKGMRLVGEWKDLEDALRGASREAAAAFGDGRLLVERYVRPARHVEVQILGDGRGGVAAIGERECSLQRRYQKIIEEAPSSAVDDDLRARLLEAARRVGAAVQYGGAGTVEFLLAPDGAFYFLEVNARLQVEHPVTELVTGLDLVRLQLQVAAGEAPNLAALAGPARGHAIEARLYAEDPASGFLPTSGRILRLGWPLGAGIRVDAGILEGQTVGTDYDPLLAKLIAWGPDREQARRRLVEALEETVLLGFRTNQSFLIDLLEGDDFREGRTFTTSVESSLSRPSEGAQEEDDLPAAVLAAAALAFTQGIGVGAADGRVGGTPGAHGVDGGSPWSTLGRWRIGSEA